MEDRNLKKQNGSANVVVICSEYADQINLHILTEILLLAKKNRHINSFSILQGSAAHNVQQLSNMKTIFLAEKNFDAILKAAKQYTLDSEVIVLSSVVYSKVRYQTEAIGAQFLDAIDYEKLIKIL